mmetsp:Transcript_1129/g.2631  ORF Transcript_1129/g.2631 Transcript_1129/m.2631 type:complete len:329 (-) Transcript_1129:105-1091(-)
MELALFVVAAVEVAPVLSSTVFLPPRPRDPLFVFLPLLLGVVSPFASALTSAISTSSPGNWASSFFLLVRVLFFVLAEALPFFCFGVVLYSSFSEVVPSASSFSFSSTCSATGDRTAALLATPVAVSAVAAASSSTSIPSSPDVLLVRLLGVLTLLEVDLEAATPPCFFPFDSLTGVSASTSTADAPLLLRVRRLGVSETADAAAAAAAVALLTPPAFLAGVSTADEAAASAAVAVEESSDSPRLFLPVLAERVLPPTGDILLALSAAAAAPGVLEGRSSSSTTWADFLADRVLVVGVVVLDLVADFLVADFLVADPLAAGVLGIGSQ